MWIKILTLLPALWGMIREIWGWFNKPKQESCTKDTTDVK